MKTYSAKAEEVQRQWFVVDASQESLGRLATQIANVLRGKHKPIYTPHCDTGDHVIVLNAENLVFTGKKMEQKIYDRYSGYTGGRRERTAQEQMDLDPTEVVRHAVKGMLPKNPLGRQMLSKLKIYAGTEHPHEAQNPQEMVLDIRG